MKRTYKVELRLREEQKEKLEREQEVCKRLYNDYIDYNYERYKEYKAGRLEKLDTFKGANDYALKLTEYQASNPEESSWLRGCGSKARKQSLVYAERAYKLYLSGGSAYPKKKTVDTESGVYYPRNNESDYIIERHKIKMPSYGWVELKEKGYIPLGVKVSGGTLKKECKRYYLSLTVEQEDGRNQLEKKAGLGIDLGVKVFATLSDGRVYGGVKQSGKLEELEKKRLKLRKKYKRSEEGSKNNTKLKLKLKELQKRQDRITREYTVELVDEILSSNPKYVVIENLSVRSMSRDIVMKKQVTGVGFPVFRRVMRERCEREGIELRVVDRYYPSTKTCNKCGNVKKEMKLSERLYECKKCGYIEDRDLNASYNLRDTKEYKVETNKKNK